VQLKQTVETLRQRLCVGDNGRTNRKIQTLDDHIALAMLWLLKFTKEQKRNEHLLYLNNCSFNFYITR
jgi:hypothetical protein